MNFLCVMCKKLACKIGWHKKHVSDEDCEWYSCSSDMRATSVKEHNIIKEAREVAEALKESAFKMIENEKHVCDENCCVDPIWGCAKDAAFIESLVTTPILPIGCSRACMQQIYMGCTEKMLEREDSMKSPKQKRLEKYDAELKKRKKRAANGFIH